MLNKDNTSADWFSPVQETAKRKKNCTDNLKSLSNLPIASVISLRFSDAVVVSDTIVGDGVATFVSVFGKS